MFIVQWKFLFQNFLKIQLQFYNESNEDRIFWLEIDPSYY